MREIFEAQAAWFRSGATRAEDNRLDGLKRLRESLLRHESELLRALRSDLGKTPEEGFLTELGPVYAEIDCMLRHAARWARPKRSLMRMPFLARREVLREPYGVVLNLAGWTKPLLLDLLPAVDAVAAGNCVMICPSLRAPQTAAVVDLVVRESFRKDHVSVTAGGREAAEELLNYGFSKIFFSGTAEEGRNVLHAAAETLTPASLELDGKNPVVVMADADIALAARRIVAAKMLCAGQSCDAPDYVLVARTAETQLLSALRAQIVEQFGRRPLESRDLPRIISGAHFDRLVDLLQGQNVFCGGGWDADALRVEPTIVSRPPMDSQLMLEPVYGPVLSVVPYGSMQEAVQLLRMQPAPHALYCFTDDLRAARRFMQDMTYGTGCLNDCGAQALFAAPYGGVGESGMGSYRGFAGFCCFAREKCVMSAAGALPEGSFAPRKGSLSVIKRLYRRG